MKVCSKCGKSNFDEAKFCIECGFNFDDVVEFNPFDDKGTYYQHRDKSFYEEKECITEGLILWIVLGFIGNFVCGILSLVFFFQAKNATNLRICEENAKNSKIAGKVGLIIGIVGYALGALAFCGSMFTIGSLGLWL